MPHKIWSLPNITSGQTDSSNSSLVTTSPACNKSCKRISMGFASSSTASRERAARGAIHRIRGPRSATHARYFPEPNPCLPCNSKTYILFRVLKNCVRTKNGKLMQAASNKVATNEPTFCHLTREGERKKHLWVPCFSLGVTENVTELFRFLEET